jgi:epoxyqueuosine reductase
VTAGELAATLRARALSRGFAKVGFTSAEPFARGGEALAAWLAAGRHGELGYMAEHAWRADPHGLLPEARSLVVVALPYARGPKLEPADDRPRGVVAKYARGRDYHLVMMEELEALGAELPALAGRPVAWKAFVDSSPILEREAAARAGVGFIAVSTMTIVPGIGTYVLLGGLLTDLELPADAPARSRCGTCDICSAACPTGAIVDRYVVDARRCISYLTIELRGVVPRELRPLVGRHVFGCDICQDVCPFNASRQPRPASPALASRPTLEQPLLEELLLLGSKPHRRLVRGTALVRVSRNQLARNAAIALGNAGDRRAVPALAQALSRHVSPVVRLHAAWALGQLGGDAATTALSLAAGADADAGVRGECAGALAART